MQREECFRVISKKIYNPVEKLLTCSESLDNMTQLKTNSDIQSVMMQLRRVSRDLMTLANNLKELGHAQPDQVELTLTTVDVVEMIQQIMQNTIRYDQSCVRILFTVSKSITTKKLITDKLRLKQVLVNLIDNALQHTVRGSVIIEVTSEGEHDFLFSVKDTGCGMKAADVLSLNKFMTGALDIPCGLGLEITRQVLCHLNSKCHYSSCEGVGTVCCFSLKQETNQFTALD
jgi:signal transduction histidine kinase